MFRGQLLISPNCVFDASLVPETCLEFPALQIRCRIRFGNLRICDWHFVPDDTHGSGTGDHWSGGKDLDVVAL